jgi:hypothetical protein
MSPEKLPPATLDLLTVAVMRCGLTEGEISGISFTYRRTPDWISDPEGDETVQIIDKQPQTLWRSLVKKLRSLVSSMMSSTRSSAK